MESIFPFQYLISNLKDLGRLTIPMLLSLTCLTFLGQKTDKVTLKNGDTITGEIKNMKLALLSFKMDGPGTISIKWEEVVGIKSIKIFEFTLRSGAMFVTNLDTLFLRKEIHSLDDIVEIIPIKDKFFSRISGDVNLGFNYTKSNSILQSNFSGNVVYKVPKLQAGLRINSVLTNYGEDTSLTKKQDVMASISYDIGKYFFIGSSLGWQENTELGLANRYLVNAIVGRELITDNHNRFYVAGGLSGNEEQSIESKAYTPHLDALFQVSYKRFYYSTPKLSINADYLIYPSLSEWGRIRMQADLNVSIEVFEDFNTGIVFYYSYDNRPPQGSLSTFDYGILLTIGYSFGK